jgi:hypothetical protein
VSPASGPRGRADASRACARSCDDRAGRQRRDGRAADNSAAGGPPIPPGPSRACALARRLQQAAPAPPAGGGDNATEALNTASLAAARRGEAFVPGAGPTGPQLAAPLLPPGRSVSRYAGRRGNVCRRVWAAGGGAPGDQGPVPLVTPASGPGDATRAPGATTDTSAAGGPGKGAAPAPAQLPGGLPDQATVTEALTLAAQWKASPNPRVREKGIVLDTAATMAQRRLDHSEVRPGLHPQPKRGDPQAGDRAGAGEPAAVREGGV